MVSGSKMVSLIEDFACSVQKKQDTEFHHHEQKMHVYITFTQDFKSLKRAIEEMGIPFGETNSY